MNKVKKLSALILTLAITATMAVPALACCGRGGGYGAGYRTYAQHGYYCGYGANCGYSYCPYVN